MTRNIVAATILVTTFAGALSGQQPSNDPRAVAIVDRAVARMGGEVALRSVKGLRMEVMTQWQRTAFGTHPYADLPSYESNVELRDYATNSYRRTTLGFRGNTNPTRVVIVKDSVAAYWLANAANPTTAFRPLSIAYVDERRELFAFAPERMLLLARDAGGLRVLPDTSIDGVAHARVTATLDGYPATFFLRRTDGLPSLVRFTADETNDYGLALWPRMEVEFWYSGWAQLQPGVLIPRQRDVRRVGRPYKRMTVLAAVINPPLAADSFAISDSLSKEYFATQTKPMWDVPFDSARIVSDNFAAFPPFSGVSAGVKIGGKWVLVETGQAGGSARMASEWLARTTPGTPIGAGVVTLRQTTNGGIAWLAEKHVPLFIAPGAASIAANILGPRQTSATQVATARWVKVGTDSLWLEPIELPDLPGTLAVYAPTHHWLYLAVAGTPQFQPDVDALLARLRAKGMPVEWMGSLRAVRTAVK
ncbi:MAG: hypothetical protein V4558_09320 [Gemmatimonadota bacterium]